MPCYFFLVSAVLGIIRVAVSRIFYIKFALQLVHCLLNVRASCRTMYLEEEASLA